MTNLRHYDNDGAARFVTFSCYRHLPSLKGEWTRRLVLKHLDAARDKHRFHLLGYVIMPDHVHFVLHPPESMKLGLVIREIKSRSAREYFARTMGPRVGGARRVFWNRRCYDHNCRTSETTLEKINYCHANPVRRGLVESPGQWVYSSYNWYQGETDVPIRIDTFGS
jgi:putative transposase